MIGSLSVSGGNSIELPAFKADAGFGVAFRPLGFGSGELSLFTNGFLVAAFLGAAAAAVVLDTVRVARVGGGGSAGWVVVFVRVDERVALGLLAMACGGAE